MFEAYNNHNFNHTDLNIYQCGMQDCDPGYSFGPAVRDHYIIHYVNKGKGFFNVGNTTYDLKKGQGFLICPGIVTFYQADMHDPWSYYWVGFHGIKAEFYLKNANLTLENPIFRYDKDDYIYRCFSDMIESKELIRSRDIRLIGLLHLTFSQLIELAGGTRFLEAETNIRELYIRKAVEFIEKSYSQKVMIADISDYIGVNIKYLCSIFKELLNTTTQQFLLNFRVDKACELMTNKFLTIGDISRSVGYDDPLQFSKIFTRAKGLSPKKYRKELLSANNTSENSTLHI
jgi:AraC-like DNA-binding protein